MVRWLLLLLVLLSLALATYGASCRGIKGMPKSVWGSNVPGESDPLTYVSLSSEILDATAPLFNHEPIADPRDTPTMLRPDWPPGVSREGSEGFYVYLRIEGKEAYTQIPLAEYVDTPGGARLSRDHLTGIRLPASRHGFHPVDAKLHEPLPRAFALLVNGSADVSALLNEQWRTEPSWQCFVWGSGLFAVVAFVLLTGILAGWKTQPAVPESLKPFAVHLMSESPPWWVVSRVFGGFCILLGVMAILSTLGDPTKVEEEIFIPLVIAMMLFGGPLGWILLGIGGQLFQRNVASVMRRKDRSPILYLRSFQSDARWLEQPIDLLWMLLFPGRFETQERSLTKALSGVGPLIAIGQPGEVLPPMGAARLYVKDDKWQEVVAHLARISGLIVLRIGKTDSFWWEVEHVVESCPPEKIIFMLPRSDRFRAYDALARHLAPRLKQLFPQPTIDMQFVGFRKDWSPAVLGRRSTSLLSRFRTFLIGSAAPVFRDELLPALRHSGYRVGRLPPLLREWFLLLLATVVLAGILAAVFWIIASLN